MTRPQGVGLDTACAQPHDGHTHTYPDPDAGRACWCRDCSTTLPIAYMKGTRDRYLNEPTVIKCRTTAELRIAMNEHRRTVHGLPADRPVDSSRSVR